MKRFLPLVLLVALSAVGMARSRNERAEIQTVYKNMARAFAQKDVKAYSTFWAPAVRWFPPKSASATTLTRDRADLLHDLRVEFAKKDRVSQEFALVRIEPGPDRATVELAVCTTHLGPPNTSRTVSERHHWLKAGGRWWLSRIESLG